MNTVCFSSKTLSSYLPGYLCLLLGFAPFGALAADRVQEIEQYGVTWHFERPVEAGRFVSGDWWVLGPVAVARISPSPGPSQAAQETDVRSRYGDRSLVDDDRMRNGSMLSPGTRGALDRQGLDSRSRSYDPSLSLELPFTLEPGDRLISSVSSERIVEDRLQTPYILGQLGVFYTKPNGQMALESAAVLTCLAERPPPDAFRPAYAGRDNPIHRARDIRWDRLPELAAPPSLPSWETFERLFERPWLEVPSSWQMQNFGPGLNGPIYGRETARLGNMAALMLMTDAPRDQKETLLIRYLQWGIDLRGMIDAGRVYFSDGGWWQGRKLPILFTALMLDQRGMAEFPPLPEDFQRLRPSSAHPKPVAVFQEDLNTYYGEGAEGQTVLWQMVWHTGAKPAYQEKPASDWTAADKRSHAYCFNNSSAGVGTALAAQLMNLRGVWQHEPFFDYIDYYMSEACFVEMPRWLPKGCRRTVDPFVEDMWELYRNEAPPPPPAGQARKFVWIDHKKAIGEWVENDRPE